MKRTNGFRAPAPGSGLQRRTPLSAKPAVQRFVRPSAGTSAPGRGKANPRRPAGLEPPEGAREAWYRFEVFGTCQVCRRTNRRRQPHHVLIEQTIRRIAPDRVFDVANRLLICEVCHANHHSGGSGRIAVARVTARAVAFAVELLGVTGAADFFHRRYKGAPSPQSIEEDACP